MERPIIDFKLDGLGDWTAVLTCGHPQHTRHRPPFENRSWVLSEQGRESKIGQLLNCVRCDDFEMPTDFVKFKTSPEFTESSVPKGLTVSHQTNSGIWGKIVIIEGKLKYYVNSKNLRFDLEPNKPGIIVPELAHYVELDGKVRFYIEFLNNEEIKSKLEKLH